MAVTTFVELKAITSEFMSKMAAVRGEMDAFQKKHTSASAAVAKAGGLGLAAIAGAAGTVALVSVKAAADFQQSMTKLVTSGGEAQKNLKSDMGGVIKLMAQTGTSSHQLADGLYVINSAGYHGAAGLQVLKAAAEGAKTENADLSDVTNGLTTMLNDYRLKSSDAALVTSKMVEATSLGKTTFQELAGSLHTVSPIAHAAGLSMNEVLGAMSTMTGEGTPAADAATYLRFAIGNLLNPTQKATKEMQALGLSQVDISKNLGQRGLTGTFKMLTDAIQNHMGPAGTVLIEKLQKSAHSTTDFQKVLANLPPVEQTYVGALANMVGGTKGMQAALELTGASASVFQENVKKVGAATTEAGGHVAGWQIIQKTFNQQMAQAKGVLEGLAIQLGSRLIPIIEKVAAFMAKHSHAVVVGLFVMAAAFGVMAAAAVAAFVAENLATLGIVAGIMALVAAGIWVATHWKQVWSDIKQWTADAVKIIKGHFLEIAAGLFVILGPIGLLVAGLLWLATHWKAVWAVLKTVVRDFVGFFTAAWDTMKTVVSDFVGFFTGAVSWLFQAGKDIVNGLWAGLRWPWDHIIKPFFNGIKTLFVDFFTKGAGSWLIKGGTDVLTGMWTGIKSVWDHIVAPFFRNIVKPIVGFFVSAVTWLFDAGRRVMSGLFNGLSNIANGMQTWFYNHIFHPLGVFFAGAISWLFNAGVNIITGMFNGIWHVASGTAEWLRVHVFHPIVDFFAPAVTWLVGIGIHLITGLFSGIGYIMGNVGAWIYSHVFLPIKNAIFSVFGLGSPSRVAMEWGVNVMEGFVAGLLKANPIAVVKTVFGSVANAASMIFGAIGGSGNTAGVSGPAPGSIPKIPGVLPGVNLSSVQTGQVLAAQYGWTGAEWNALYNLWNGESGWNKFAENVSSGAYGIPQALPASKMASAGADWSTNAATQIAWGLSYIRSVYGDPIRAYSMWLGRSPHWYDNGGILPPGLTLALNTTGRNEYVVGAPPGGGSDRPTVVVLEVDGQRLGQVMLTQLLREQQRRPLGIKAI